MELEILNINGEKTGKKIKLDKNIFDVKVNEHAVYLDVKRILANKRQGTHSSKERSQLSGSTRKIKRQKGTGTARAGDIKSPLFRGGARVFGPHPRDYKIKINKKLKSLARKSALSSKFKKGEIIIVEDFKLNKIKTKEYLKILKNLKSEKNKTLMILPETDKNILLSARNLPNAEVLNFNNLSTYNILKYNKLIFTEKSIEKLQEQFKK